MIAVLFFSAGSSLKTPDLDFKVKLSPHRCSVCGAVSIYTLVWYIAESDSHHCPQDYSVEQLEVGYETGADRLLLWLPMVITHVIDDDSPLSNWRDPDKVLHDSDATIVVVVRIILLIRQSKLDQRLAESCRLGGLRGVTVPVSLQACQCELLEAAALAELDICHPLFANCGLHTTPLCSVCSCRHVRHN